LSLAFLNKGSASTLIKRSLHRNPLQQQRRSTHLFGACWSTSHPPSIFQQSLWGRRKEETNIFHRERSQLESLRHLLFRKRKRRVGRRSITMGRLARLVCPRRLFQQ